MGISGKSSAQKAQETQAANQNATSEMQNKILGLQYNNMTALNPKELQAQNLTMDQNIKDLSSPVWDQGRSMAEKIMPQLGYQEIGFNNQGVKDIQNYLNSNSTAYAKDLIAGSNDKMAGSKLTGSSYDAVAKAKLADLFSRMYNENAVNALGLQQGIYNNNISNGMNLVKFGMGDPSSVAMPTAPSVSNPYSGSSAGGNSSGSSFKTSASDIANATSTLAGLFTKGK